MQTSLIAFRLLVAAAWSDGELHPLEGLLLGQYLIRLDLDPSEYQRQVEYLRTRPATDTSHLWVEQFQKAHPSTAEQQSVINAIKAMIQADGKVALQETQILHELEHALQEAHPPSLLARLKAWFTNLVR